MSVNYGGIVIVAAADVVRDCLRSCCRRMLRCSRRRRLGSMSVQQLFFDELATVMDRFTTHHEPIYVVGELNVRLDRPDVPHADQFHLRADCYGLKLHATGPTHHLGGTLDAVITQETTGCPECVAVEEVGLSDHHLLRWEVSTTRSMLSVATVRARPWRHLDIRSALSTTRLCYPDDWPTDIDEMAALYDTKLIGLLDRLITFIRNNVQNIRNKKKQRKEKPKLTTTTSSSRA